MSAAVPVSEMGMVITMQESSPAPRGSLPELCTFGGIALADMIRRRKVSAEEVMATYLDPMTPSRGVRSSALCTGFRRRSRISPSRGAF
jgi:hypothetical protein